MQGTLHCYLVSVAETVFVIPAQGCHPCESRDGNPAFSLWTPALGSRKAGSLAGVTSSVFVFRNRYYLALTTVPRIVRIFSGLNVRKHWQKDRRYSNIYPRFGTEEGQSSIISIKWPASADVMRTRRLFSFACWACMLNYLCIDYGQTGTERTVLRACRLIPLGLWPPVRGQYRRLFGNCVVRLPALSRGPHFPKSREMGTPGKISSQIEVASPKNAEIFEKL